MNSNSYFGFYANDEPGWEVFRRELVAAYNPSTSKHEPLKPVYDPSNVVPGTFYVHAPDCTPLLGPDSLGCKPEYILAKFWSDLTPSQAQPAIGVRSFLFRGVGSLDLGSAPGGGYIISDIIFQFSNNKHQEGAVCLNWVDDVGCNQPVPNGSGEIVEANSLGSDSELHNVVIEWNNAWGLDISGDHNWIDNVSSVSNGQMGMGGSCNYCLITDGAASYNNWKGFDPGWEAGGAKFTYLDGTTVRRLRASSNAGPGIWLDGYNTNNVIEGCLVDGNDTAGIFLEHASDNNLIQHNIVTYTWYIGGVEAAGLLERASRRNYFYHNSFFNNRLQGFMLNNDSRIGDGSIYTDWIGHEASMHNNLLIGNGISQIFPPDPLVAGREIHIEDDCNVGTQGIQTNDMNGNIYYRHDNSIYPQDEDLCKTFRALPSDSSCDVLATNSLSSWITLTLEGTESGTRTYDQISSLGVDVLDLSEPGPGPSPNANWPLLAFTVNNSVSTKPSCDTSENPDCAPDAYDKAGAHMNAVFDGWLDDASFFDSVPVTVANDGHAPGTFTLTHVYPNPVYSAATMRLDLPSSASVQLVLYDILGRRVQEMANKDFIAGRHLFVLDGSELPSGTYVIRAVVAEMGSTSTHVLTQRVTVLH